MSNNKKFKFFKDKNKLNLGQSFFWDILSFILNKWNFYRFFIFDIFIFFIVFFLYPFLSFYDILFILFLIVLFYFIYLNFLAFLVYKEFFYFWFVLLFLIFFSAWFFVNIIGLQILKYLIFFIIIFWLPFIYLSISYQKNRYITYLFKYYIWKILKRFRFRKYKIARYYFFILSTFFRFFHKFFLLKIDKALKYSFSKIKKYVWIFFPSFTIWMIFYFTKLQVTFYHNYDNFFSSKFILYRKFNFFNFLILFLNINFLKLNIIFRKINRLNSFFNVWVLFWNFFINFFSYENFAPKKSLNNTFLFLDFFSGNFYMYFFKIFNVILKFLMSFIFLFSSFKNLFSFFKKVLKFFIFVLCLLLFFNISWVFFLFLDFMLLFLIYIWESMQPFLNLMLINLFIDGFSISFIIFQFFGFITYYISIIFDLLPPVFFTIYQLFDFIVYYFSKLIDQTLCLWFFFFDKFIISFYIFIYNIFQFFFLTFDVSTNSIFIYFFFDLNEKFLFYLDLKSIFYSLNFYIFFFFQFLKIYFSILFFFFINFFNEKFFYWYCYFSLSFEILKDYFFWDCKLSSLEVYKSFETFNFFDKSLSNITSDSLQTIAFLRSSNKFLFFHQNFNYVLFEYPYFFKQDFYSLFSSLKIFELLFSSLNFLFFLLLIWFSFLVYFLKDLKVFLGGYNNVIWYSPDYLLTLLKKKDNFFYSNKLNSFFRIRKDVLNRYLFALRFSSKQPLENTINLQYLNWDDIYFFLKNINCTEKQILLLKKIYFKNQKNFFIYVFNPLFFQLFLFNLVISHNNLNFNNLNFSFDELILKNKNLKIFYKNLIDHKKKEFFSSELLFFPWSFSFNNLYFNQTNLNWFNYTFLIKFFFDSDDQYKSDGFYDLIETQFNSLFHSDKALEQFIFQKENVLKSSFLTTVLLDNLYKSEKQIIKWSSSQGFLSSFWQNIPTHFYSQDLSWIPMDVDESEMGNSNLPGDEFPFQKWRRKYSSFLLKPVNSLYFFFKFLDINIFSGKLPLISFNKDWYYSETYLFDDINSILPSPVSYDFYFFWFGLVFFKLYSFSANIWVDPILDVIMGNFISYHVLFFYDFTHFLFFPLYQYFLDSAFTNQPSNFFRDVSASPLLKKSKHIFFYDINNLLYTPNIVELSVLKLISYEYILRFPFSQDFYVFFSQLYLLFKFNVILDFIYYLFFDFLYLIFFTFFFSFFYLFNLNLFIFYLFNLKVILKFTFLFLFLFKGWKNPYFFWYSFSN